MRITNKSSFESSSRGHLVRTINYTKSEANSNVTDKKFNKAVGFEPFGGKSGSVSFIALISSVLIPQFFGILSTDLIQDVVLTEIVYTVSSEIMFYICLATFLLVTDRVQRPYLQYSTKRWSLITGLIRYLSSAFFVMGFKVIVPVFATFVTWPLLGVAGLVAVGPYLMGCLVQFIFEKVLEKRQSSCWPIVPIVFEVYRLYQLSKAMHFMEKLMYQMRGLPKSPELMEKSGALAAMIVTFEVLAVICIWFDLYTEAFSFKARC